MQYLYIKEECNMLSFYMTLVDEEDQSKFEEIYYAYRKQMFFLAQGILKSQMDAEDAVHEVFVNIAVKHMKTIKNISSEDDLRNYILKATKNTALNIAKKKSRTVSLDTDFNPNFALEKVTDNSFKESICEQINYDSLVEAILRLDEKYRDVIYFHYVVGLTLQETAVLLNRKIATVNTQIVRGKKILLKNLEMVDKNNGNN